MAKKSKKALGAAMAGVMAVGAVSGAVNAATQVNVVNAATESQAVKNAKAKINHLIWSINNNYAGLKNQAQWEAYVKEAKALIAKIPAGEKAQADALTKQVAGISDTIMAIARINQVEKSYATNYKGIKNASQWREYLDLATEDLKSVDKSVFAAKYEELVERLNAASDDVAAIEEAHYAEIEKIEAKLEKAEKAGDVDALKELLEVDMKKLGSHESTDELRDKIVDAIDAANNKTVISAKSTNATTVEVTFKNKVEDVNALKFSIEGLEVKNAAIKQTDSKVVILTTSAQEGGKEYTVKLAGSEVGKFKGVSSVIPTSVKLENNAVQAKVGQEVTLKANIGQKVAGVAVTFNIDAANNSLNKDIVAEAYTDANGIASYTYTQYNAGLDNRDDVAVYPTGNPSTRDVATVFWGVDTILSLSSDDNKGNAITNGANKVYKVVYKDAKTGKPVEGKKINVTFKENIDVNIDKITKATVNGVNPYQLSNGNKSAVQITTNSKGEATFTVTGTNTKATPIVFVDEYVNTTEGNGKLDSKELQAIGEQLTFAADQVNYDIAITRDGGEEAVIGTSDDDGRLYKVVVKTKDGKVAANEIVNVALYEDIDRNISTNTNAYIKDHADADEYLGSFVGDRGPAKKVTIKLNNNGEAEFKVVSSVKDDYATPVVWLDINSSNAADGQLDDGEAYKLGDKSYFVNAKVSTGILTGYDVNGKKIKDSTTLKGDQSAKFVFDAANQSGKAMNTVNGINASYTVFNTGSNDVVVYDNNGVQKAVVSPNRSVTVQIDTNSTGVGANFITVKPSGDKNASVRVEANATTKATNNENAVYLGNKTATAKFVSTNSVSDFYTGKITGIDTSIEKIYFDSKQDGVSYKDATFIGVNGASITKAGFEGFLASGQYTATYKKDGDGKVQISLIERTSSNPTNPNPTDTVAPQIQGAKAIDEDGDKKIDGIQITFTENVSGVDAANFSFSNDNFATKVTGKTVTIGADKKVATIKVDNGSVGATTLKLKYNGTSVVDAAGNKLVSVEKDVVTTGFEDSVKVEWVTAPKWNGFTSSINGKVDTTKVDSVKAVIDGVETNVTINEDGTFSYDASNNDIGTKVVIKAFKGKEEVNSKEVIVLI